ncbi:MAG: hypothetical protein J7L14_02330 [Candidatus Diapherotrites archaeon]|nr:hypothetical protein [Candidatus Diapherotrites archaeon]
MLYDRQYLLLGIIAVIIIALFVIFLLPPVQKEPTPPAYGYSSSTTPTKAITKPETEANFDEYYFAKAKEENNAAYCGMISDERKRNKCFSQVKESRSIASEQETKPQQQTEEFDNYYFNKAKQEQNNVYCGMINDAQLREECFSQVQETKPIGEGITEIESSELDEYYLNKAKEEQNAVYCGMIANDKIREECFNLGYETKPLGEG